MRRNLRWIGVLLMTLAGCDDGERARDLGAGADLAAGGGAADLSMEAAPADMSAGADDLAMAPDLSAAEGPAPFIVDGTYAASGSMGGGDVPGTITDDEACPARGGDGRGKCHHVQWTPGTNSWGGVMWQFPADNWGSKPGFAIPAGYGQVRFTAWGKAGGEAVSFLAGLGAGGPDKFQGRLDVTLTAQPKQYVVGVRGAYRDEVVSAFGWVTGAGAAETFYVDDIVWVAGDEGSGGAGGNPAPLPVDGTFGASGYIGDGTAGFVTRAACPSAAPGCHRFTWNPEADAGGHTQGWAGVFWQSAPGNWAGPSDPAGAAVAAGYREIRFRAASNGAGGETVTFLAGMGAGTHDGWQSKLDVQLAATPTTYALGVGGAYSVHVVGGFGWVAGGSGLDFTVDGATWR